MSTKVQLTTSDQKVFIVDVDILRCSNTIMAMLDNQEKIPAKEISKLNLGGIHSEILNLVIQWAGFQKVFN